MCGLRERKKNGEAKTTRTHPPTLSSQPFCTCVTCHNSRANEAERQAAVEAVLDRNKAAFRPKVAPSSVAGASSGGVAHVRGCNCRMSRCLKKYCECYQAGVPCTIACRCTECKNGKPPPRDRGDWSAGAPTLTAVASSAAAYELATAAASAMVAARGAAAASVSPGEGGRAPPAKKARSRSGARRPRPPPPPGGLLPHPGHPLAASVAASIGDAGVTELVTSLVSVLNAHAAGSGAGAAAAAAAGLPPPPPGAPPPPPASATFMAAEAAVLESFVGAVRATVASVLAGVASGGGGGDGAAPA